MNLMYPKYLNDAGFEYRHVKIKIIENTIKLDDPAGAKALKQQVSVETDQVIASAKRVTDFNSAGNLLKNTSDSIQKLKKTLRKGCKSIHNLTLPLPNSLVDNINHDWSAEKGIAGTAADALSSHATAQLAGSVTKWGTDLGNIRKPLADPGYFQNYTGTQPRDFSLSFDLIPNSVEDASEIYAIILLLKKYSAPSTALASALILAPHFFEIEFTNPYINTLIRATDVVLKSMTVDYGADGYMQQTPDGIPKYIKLDLVFAERHMMTSEMY